MTESSATETMFCALPYAQKNGYYLTLRPQIDQSPLLDTKVPSMSGLVQEQAQVHNLDALVVMH